MIEPLTVFVSVAISVLIFVLFSSIFSPKREDEKKFNVQTRYLLDRSKNDIAGELVSIRRSVDNVRHTAAQTDEIISKSVDALATHLKLEIIPYKKQATESQILFNVVKLKKHKK